MKMKAGVFYVDRQQVVDNPNNNIHKLFRELRFISLRTELLAYRDAFEYLGISPMFDEIDTAVMAAPEYSIVMKTAENGAVKVTVTRCKGSQ